MKKILFLILIVFELNAQVKNTEQPGMAYNLCYDEEFTEHIAVGSVELSTLSILDKLKFKEKKYLKKHLEYINEAGNATHDIAFVSHVNMFPKWYTHPSVIRINEVGVKSFFSEKNDYMDYITEERGSDPSNTKPTGAYMMADNLRYLDQPYSDAAAKAYEEWNNTIDSLGFLYRYAFRTPKTEQLTQFQNEGFNVNPSNKVTLVEGSTIILVWDVEEKIFIKQIIDGETVVRTTKTYYKYDRTFETELINKIVTIIPGTFDNGDCYETITTTQYTNYSNELNRGKSVFRKMEENGSIPSGEGLNIYPNPSREHIEIVVNSYDGKSTIQVFDIAGSLILTRSVHPQQTKIRLNINSLPIGMYYVKLLQGGDIYSSKFIKQ